MSDVGENVSVLSGELMTEKLRLPEGDGVG